MPSATFSINWNSLTLSQWRAYFLQLEKSTLLQSYGYGRAAGAVLRQKPRFGLIEDKAGPLGLVLAMEGSAAGGLLRSVSVDRGPLWFSGCDTPPRRAAFARALADEYPRSWLLPRRWLPEGGDAADYLAAGFRPRSGSYETQWLDLRPEVADLRSNLRKSWRQGLARAERAPIALDWDETGARAAAFIRQYAADKAARGYGGASPRLLAALIREFSVTGDVLIGTAGMENLAAGAILILCHGQSATYQAGWALPAGRDSGAMNLLLWRALDRLKARGINHLDLGGINDQTADGVKRFKQGMGGAHHALPGVFC